MSRRLSVLAVVMALASGFLVADMRLEGNDRAYYWSQLTSVWYDGDLLLHDDLLANENSAVTQLGMLTHADPDGVLVNKFPFGLALVDGLYVGPAVLLMRLLDRPRFDRAVAVVMACGSLVKVFLLAVLLVRLLSTANPEMTSSCRSFVAACVLVGSPLAYYGFQLLAMSHLNSALLATLFVDLLLRWFKNATLPGSVALGLTFTALIITHWQNGVFVLFGAVVLAGNRRRMPAGSGVRTMGLIAAGAAAGLLVATAQGLAFYRQTGSFFEIRHGSGFFVFSVASIPSFLFSGYHGLLTWHPVFVLALAGLAAGVCRGPRRNVFLAALLTVLVTLYLDASVRDWWSGTSYGQRRASVLVPLFALGLGEVLRRLPRWRGALLVLTAAWSLATLTMYNSRIDDLRLVFAGEPSPVALESRSSWFALDQDAARQGFVYFRERFLHKLSCPFEGHLCDGTGPAWTLGFLGLLAASAFLVARWGGRLAAGWRTFGRWATFLFAAYVLVFNASVALFVDGVDDGAGDAWRRFLEGETGRHEAASAGVPLAAAVFLDAAALRCAGDARTEAVLGEIDRRLYPNLRPEALDAVCSAPLRPSARRALEARARRLFRRDPGF